MIWWEREIYAKIVSDYQEQKKHETMAAQHNLGGFGV
jgi:hypothetical protein